MDIFAALADPTRRSILELLASNGPLSAKEIYAHFPVSPPAISRHLKVLKEAKLVRVEKRAQQRMYQINPDAMIETEAWPKHITQLWNQRFDTLERVLEEEKKHIAQHEREKISIMTTQENQRKEVTITRLFDAPRELVFKAWIDPKLVAQWWGPNGFTNPVCELDVRPGGAIRIDMRGPDGVVYPNKGVFQEVVEPERLVLIMRAFENEEGHPQLEVLTTVTFAERDGKTKLTLHTTVIKSTPEVAAAVNGMEEGWGQSLGRLAERLESW
jgi:uncharacterized protein YndB with AHSA1/START domain/DNA-binding transcriptional ArsR family regulator